MLSNNMINNSATSTSVIGTYSPFISGNWYKCGGPLYIATALGDTSFATGTIYFRPFFLPVTTTFTDIATFVVSGGAGNVNMGVYASDNTNTQPTGSPLSDTTSGSISCVSTGEKTFTFGTPKTLSPGIYWLAMTCDDFINFVFSNQGTIGYESTSSLGIATLATDEFFATVGWSQAFVYNTTLPVVSSLTSLNAGDQPANVMIWLKAQ